MFLQLVAPVVNMADKNHGSSEQINTEIVTLSRYLSEEQTKHKEATGDFTYVLLKSRNARRR